MLDPVLQAIGCLIFLCGAIWTITKVAMKDIHQDLKDIRGEIQGIKGDIQGIKSDINRIEEEQQIARVRTDHLYELVCKLFKEDKRA